MKEKSIKTVAEGSKARLSRANQIRRLQVPMSDLIKLQRLFLKHSSNPSRSYQSSLLMDYPNPAEDVSRIITYDTQFKVDYLCHNLFRKIYVAGTTDKGVLASNALHKMLQGERHCLRTNRRLQRIDKTDESLNTMVFRLQRFIANLLGPVKEDDILHLSKFSSGATADLSLREAMPQEKFSFSNPSSTLSCIREWGYAVRSTDPDATGLNTQPLLVAGNRILTVPKNSKTDRTIAAEPTLNMYFQLGVGAFLKRRLRSAGIDLSDQTRNQRLARIGSLDGKLATIDLANASNSLSYEAVKLLLPSDWFIVLDSLRSAYGKLPNGKLHKYHMFSSMGNGYTFELETLIFFAICKVICGKSTVSVYGDDIICPSDKAEEVISWLSFFGFETNKEKTFSVGFFRESCGKHYYFGEDVSPFFVRKLPESLDVFLLYNNIIRCATSDSYYDIRFEEAREFVLRLIPEDSRVYGPDGYGDGHLLDHTYDLSLTKFKYSVAVQNLVFPTIIRKPRKRLLANQHGALASSLLGNTKETQVSTYASEEMRYEEIRVVHWSNP